MYEMKEEYLTGIPQIDEEHTRIFELAEQAYQLLQDEHRYDKYDDLVYLVEELKNYTKYHFQHEEEYMESIDYQAIFIQRVQHKDFIEKLDDFNIDEEDSEHEDTIIDLLNLITEWLIDHILKMDKMIGQ
ncbi:MAG: hemerythrin family protein [Lachnospiraceae bacterium]|nr:hemerythrin family protein [Lachnospiraceae bacterium]MCI7594934.1 hemerythrin family protein [Lachnospiraceae bacterium]MDD7051579.1 hemerythrin family protein [Lachnospiraceae bacterium]MDY4097172.1 hemerythrin family protein [Lachnospiraceae bacterium]